MRNFLRRIRLMLHLAKNDTSREPLHHGHDVAKTATDASHAVRGPHGGTSGSSAVDRHVASGASSYARSSKKRR